MFFLRSSFETYPGGASGTVAPEGKASLRQRESAWPAAGQSPRSEKEVCR